MLFIFHSEILESSSVKGVRKDRQNKGKAKEIKPDVQRKSLMEFLLMSTPLAHVTFLLTPALYYVSLDIPILLISTFPTQSRNFGTISLCLSWDMFCISIIVAWVIYPTFMIISFVLAYKDTADLAMKEISRWTF